MPLAGGADESGEVQRRLMFFSGSSRNAHAVARFFLESWPRQSPPRRPV